MSGMIWSALGQGLANVGGTVSGLMMKDIEDRRRREEEDRKEANYVKRLEEADRVKAERDAAREEALQQRVIKESQAARTRAGEVGAAREEQRLTQDAERLAAASASIAGDSPSTTAEQFKQMLKDNPKLRDLYAGTGVVGRNLTADDQRIQAASDLAQAAMDIGAHSSVIKAYQADRDATLKEIRERRREDRSDAREERLAKEGREQFEQTSRRLDILQQNANTAKQRADSVRVRGQDYRTASDFTQRERTLRTQIGKAFGDQRTNLQDELDELLTARKSWEAGTTAPAPAPTATTPRPGAPAPGNNRGNTGTRNYSNLWN